ncbi:MAG: NfeD family protein [Oscillospiraceae bacterium]|jgi:membrane protein implicated in regulation of membrane protease activity|nr:NfeD family protein [Oscillospiraceae bacterium]
MQALIFWGVILIMALIVEFNTAALISVWFAVGALAAYIASFFGDFIAQLGTFVFVSTLALVLTFVVFKKKPFQPQKNVTGNDLFIGKNALVTENVDNVRGLGRVKMDDIDWCAVSENGNNIPADTIVSIVSVKGSTLTVKPVA